MAETMRQKVRMYLGEYIIIQQDIPVTDPSYEMSGSGIVTFPNKDVLEINSNGVKELTKIILDWKSYGTSPIDDLITPEEIQDILNKLDDWGMNSDDLSLLTIIPVALLFWEELMWVPEDGVPFEDPGADHFFRYRKNLSGEYLPELPGDGYYPNGIYKGEIKFSLSLSPGGVTTVIGVADVIMYFPSMWTIKQKIAEYIKKYLDTHDDETIQKLRVDETRVFAMNLIMLEYAARTTFLNGDYKESQDIITALETSINTGVFTFKSGS